MKLLVLIFVVLVLTLPARFVAQDKLQIAGQETVRLSPTAFSQLPENIVTYLTARHCSIPQAFNNVTPTNVIRGQFARSGQFDWAVLCSRNRVSAILVFWNGSTKSVAEIGRFDEKEILQTIDGEKKIGFCRAIGVVRKNYSLEHYRAYGGVKPPEIKHQGINDGFVGKASSVHYFYRGRWVKLQGAD